MKKVIIKDEQFEHKLSILRIYAQLQQSSEVKLDIEHLDAELAVENYSTFNTTKTGMLCGVSVVNIEQYFENIKLVDWKTTVTQLPNITLDSIPPPGSSPLYIIYKLQFEDWKKWSVGDMYIEDGVFIGIITKKTADEAIGLLTITVLSNEENNSKI